MKPLEYEFLVVQAVGMKVMGEPIALMYWESNDLTKLIEYGRVF